MIPTTSPNPPAFRAKVLQVRRHGWLIRRFRQTVARPLVGRMIRYFRRNVADSKSSDPQGVGLQTSQIHELASRDFGFGDRRLALSLDVWLH